MIREWADGQGEQNREIKRLLERSPAARRRADGRDDMLDHVTIGVRDVEQSKKFYDRALAPLGITRLYAEGERFAGYGVSPKAFFWIGTRADPADRRAYRFCGAGPRDRGTVS